MTATPDSVVAAVAGRLTDHPLLPDYARLSFAVGGPGIAALYAELSHAVDAGAAHRRTAHGYLAVAAGAVSDGAGLYHGPVALGFAMSLAARRPGDYAGALERLDASVVEGVDAVLDREAKRVADGRAGTDFAAYDAVTGLTGVGRYLLRRGIEPTLRLVLAYLVTLTEPLDDRPGWWVAHAADRFDDRADGHANLGLAHGIAGPLALLALCRRSGLRVAGQDDAMAAIVDWLLEWRRWDAFGPYWPSTLSARDLADPPAALEPARAAWCYGTPGIARALQLAGLALGRDDWSSAAIGAVRAMLARPAETYHAADAGLCHGWGGLLHVTRLIGADAGGPAWATEAADRFAARAVATADPAGGPGFLDGAAGTALALRAYLTGAPPATGWDAALLVA